MALDILFLVALAVIGMSAGTGFFYYILSKTELPVTWKLVFSKPSLIRHCSIRNL